MFKICRYIFQSFPLNKFPGLRSLALNSCSDIAQGHTAGLIIIGDEILKAQVKDTNSSFMCRLLYECGVKVKKISVIPDDIDVIANEIRDFSEKYTYVITSGGIGPTHDDMTFEGLAKAFNDTLHHHPTLVEIVNKLLKPQAPDAPGYKLAHIPKKATLKFGIDPKTGNSTNYPCIAMKNVYVFPGSPVFLECSFGSLYKELFKTDRKFVKTELFVNAKEDCYAAALTRVATEFPRVTFGSYPVSDSGVAYKARVTIESENESETNEARDKFVSLVPPEILVKIDGISGPLA
ncbi:FAD synthase-like [Venturia canescens]|uniref:FAD synthase-like n=1 Tax=Venturia canescens TaxID=32260 RepID=UPI001C9C1366|nr:FAD synthase-like [Venturia canescens]XP_043269557.1 FAD synthase-like [Venturia canescens]